MFADFAVWQDGIPRRTLTVSRGLQSMAPRTTPTPTCLDEVDERRRCKQAELHHRGQEPRPLTERLTHESPHRWYFPFPKTLLPECRSFRLFTNLLIEDGMSINAGGR